MLSQEKGGKRYWRRQLAITAIYACLAASLNYIYETIVIVVRYKLIETPAAMSPAYTDEIFFNGVSHSLTYQMVTLC